jgi:hypothetical protein
MGTAFPLASTFVSVAVAVTDAVPFVGPPPDIVAPSEGVVIATEGSAPTMTVVGAGVSVGSVLVVEAMTLFLSS